MKFQYIGKKQNTNAYNIVAGLKTGDVISLVGNLANKAKTNPDFKEVGKNSKVTITPEQSEKIKEEQQFDASKEDLQKIAELMAQAKQLEQRVVSRQEEPEADIDGVFDDED